jgi:hypothetical protein
MRDPALQHAVSAASAARPRLRLIDVSKRSSRSQ